MENKINTYLTFNLSARLKYLLILVIFSILVIFQSIYAQEQWRVFTPFNSGLPSFNVGSIAIDTKNVKWIGTDSGLARFDGINWTVFDTSNSFLPHNKGLSLALDKFNNIWIGVGEKGLVKFDGISNWTIYDTNNSGLPSNLIRDISVDLYNVKWICTTNKGLVKFDDVTWITYDTNNSGLASNITWEIVIEENIKWVGTFARGISRFNDTTWTTYNIYNSGLPSDVIKGLTIDNMNNLWVATQFGGAAKFNYTLNQWTVYNTINSGLPENNLYTILTDKYKKWIGTQAQGIAFYNDTIWIVHNTQNSPLPGNTVTYLALDSNKNLWISTVGGLAVYNENGIIGINKNNHYLPQDFVLHQNYPNPFNPFTKIVFEILKSTIVQITVYDTQGKLITVLKNTYHEPGKYYLTFDGNNLPSGVYYYRLKTENFSDTRKMILIK